MTATTETTDQIATTSRAADRDRPLGATSTQGLPVRALKEEADLSGRAPASLPQVNFESFIQVRNKVLSARLVELTRLRAGRGQPAEAFSKVVISTLGLSPEILQNIVAPIKDADEAAVESALGWIARELLEHDGHLGEALRLARLFYSGAGVPGEVIMAIQARLGFAVEAGIPAPRFTQERLLAHIEEGVRLARKDKGWIVPGAPGVWSSARLMRDRWDRPFEFHLEIFDEPEEDEDGDLMEPRQNEPFMSGMPAEVAREIVSRNGLVADKARAGWGEGIPF